MPVIVNGTTVTDFFFRNGLMPFSTKALNPDIVSDSSPVVCRIPSKFMALSIKLYAVVEDARD